MRPWAAIPVALMMFSAAWFMYTNQEIVESWVNRTQSVDDDWDPYTLPFQSEERWLVFVVEFSDKPSRTGKDVSAAQSLLTGERGFAEYHSALLAGQGNLTFDFHPIVISANHAESDYGADAGGKRDAGSGTGGASGLAVEVLTKANSQGVDWSHYDLDADGDVDRLIILHTGGVQEDGGGPGTIWSHFGFLEEEQEFNGTRIGAYAMSGIGSEIGTVIHEMLHSYQAVDLYAVHDESAGDPWKGVGDFDIMASGNWAEDEAGKSQPVLPMAATMNLIGVQRYTELNPGTLEAGVPTNVTLEPMSQGGSAARIALAEDEFVWLEYRTQSGADVGLPGEGLLVSIQDLSVGNVSLNNVNRASNDPWLMVIEADRDGGLTSGSNNGEASDMFGESESFGSSGVEIRDRYGFLVPWNIEIITQEDSSLTLALTLSAKPSMAASISHNPVGLLSSERLEIEVLSEEPCLLEGQLSSSDGRLLSIGPVMLAEGKNSAEGIWSSNESTETAGELHGSLACDGVDQLDWRFGWNLIGNRILTSSHSDTVHWQQSSELLLQLEYEGDAARTYEIEYVGPLERIVTGPASVSLSPGDELQVAIEPQGLLTPGMYARGEIVLHEGGFEHRIKVVLQAELIEGQSSVAGWIGGPGQLLAISLGLAGLWVLLGMRTRSPPKSSPIPMPQQPSFQQIQQPQQPSFQQIQQPQQASVQQIPQAQQRRVDDLLKDLW